MIKRRIRINIIIKRWIRIYIIIKRRIKFKKIETSNEN